MISFFDLLEELSSVHVVKIKKAPTNRGFHFDFEFLSQIDRFYTRKFFTSKAKNESSTFTLGVNLVMMYL